MDFMFPQKIKRNHFPLVDKIHVETIIKEDTSTFPKFQTNAVKYFILVFQFASYSLIAPFNITINDDKIVLHKSRIQKVLCICCLLWTCVERIYRIILATNKPSNYNPLSHNPALLYEFVQESSMTLGMFYTIKLVWIRYDNVLEMCKSMFRSDLQQNSRYSKYYWISKEGLVIGVLGLLCLTDAVADQIKLFVQYPVPQGHLGEQGLFAVIQYWIWNNIHNVSKWGLILVFSLLGLISTLLIYFSVLIFNVVTCLVISQIGIDWKRFLKKSEQKEASWENLMENLEQLKAHLKFVNDNFGSMILSYLVAGVVAFSNFLSVLMTTSDIHSIVLLSTAFLIYLSSLLLASTAHENFHLIERYIFNNRNLFAMQRPSEVSIVLHELTSQPMGLQAYSFLITNGLIMTVLSTVITYFFVIMQFNINGLKP